MHDFRPGDRIQVKGQPSQTGTVREQRSVTTIVVDWDDDPVGENPYAVPAWDIEHVPASPVIDREALVAWLNLRITDQSNLQDETKNPILQQICTGRISAYSDVRNHLLGIRPTPMAPLETITPVAEPQNGGA